MTLKSHFDDKPRFKVINGWLAEYLLKLSSVFHLRIKTLKEIPTRSHTLLSLYVSLCSTVIVCGENYEHRRQWLEDRLQPELISWMS